MVKAYLLDHSLALLCVCVRMIRDFERCSHGRVLVGNYSWPFAQEGATSLLSQGAHVLHGPARP